jgi:hypothetical protein
VQPRQSLARRRYLVNRGRGKDDGGGVLPGASVVVASNATGTKSEAITNSTGTCSIPALSASVYTVTVSLTGFKTSIINDVTPASDPLLMSYFFLNPGDRAVSSVCRFEHTVPVDAAVIQR